MTTNTIPTRTKAEALKLIDETVAYYAADPQRRRAKDNSGCSYETDDGRRCAVGRCLQDPRYIQIVVVTPLACSALPDRMQASTLDELLKPEYRGYPEELWRLLQRLHDSTVYWNTNGLTLTGRERVDTIKEWVRYGSGLMG
jgi:hypothetical protein